MFLDDAFEDSWIAAVIPDPLRVYNRNGTTQANAQTTHFASAYMDRRSLQPQFSQSPLQVFPGFFSGLRGAAPRLVGVCAKEDVMRKLLQSESSRHFPQLVTHCAV